MFGILGALGILGAWGVSGAKAAVEDVKMKNSSREVDKNGNVHYYDRLCREYINGERVERISRRDKYGAEHIYTVGVQSKKIYSDTHDIFMERMKKEDEKELQMANKYGDLAYNKYDPRFDKAVTTEISTGKVIVCLAKTWNEKMKKQIYRKFYAKPFPKKFDYNKTAEGDYGIDITEDEYKKLNIICGTFAKIPTDPDVLNEFWGVDWFK